MVAKPIKPCVGYCRVSTADQAADGVSLAAQKAKIAAWAALQDVQLLETFEDAGISGKIAHTRPGLQAALDMACRKKAALVVYSLSRLARSTQDAIMISERLAKAHADLVSLTENIDTTTAAGRMVFKVLAVLAEFERDTISERTKAAMAYQRSQHKRISRTIPFGYDLAKDGESLTLNDGEQKAAMMIVRMREHGQSLRGICTVLKARGIKSKTGNGNWSPSVVNAVLRRMASEGV